MSLFKRLMMFSLCFTMICSQFNLSVYALESDHSKQEMTNNNVIEEDIEKKILSEVMYVIMQRSKINSLMNMDMMK